MSWFRKRKLFVTKLGREYEQKMDYRMDYKLSVRNYVERIAICFKYGKLGLWTYCYKFKVLQERKSLLYACAILFGALYPAFRARDELAQQRSLLERFINNWDVCKLKMRLGDLLFWLCDVFVNVDCLWFRSLVATFHDELGNEEDDSPSIPASFRFTSPLIRFGQ